MKIHYFSSEEWEEEYTKANLGDNDISFHRGPLSAFPDLTDPEAEALCVFIDSKIGEADLERFPKLKLIATRSTGFDHINLVAAKTRGVTLVNVPFYGENTVAEFAFALILALSRRIIDADERVRQDCFSPTGLRGFDLSGKTLGVVGTGHIGAHVIRIAKGFGMKVIGFDAFPNAELSHTLDFSYVPLNELLGAADIVTLHVPYNEHTHHLINKGNIGNFKKGSYLINTARGAVVETEALVDGIKDGTLAGAGLDVLEEEEMLGEKGSPTAMKNHFLIEHPQVIVTPHLAFNTTEAVKRILDTTIENIKSFGAGTPKNTVA